MAYLQAVFTTLWPIWTYRNRVIHQGICPNPLYVLLMGQSLSCKYRNTFISSDQNLRDAALSISVQRPATVHQQSPVGQWDLIIKIAATKGQRSQRKAFAYNANNMEGVCVFSGVASTLASSTIRALFEAMIDATTIARDHGFQHILFLIDSRNVA